MTGDADPCGCCEVNDYDGEDYEACHNCGHTPEEHEPAAAAQERPAPGDAGEMAALRELLRLNRQLVITLRRIGRQQEDGGHAEAAYATGCAATMVEALWPVCNEKCTDTTHHHQPEPEPAGERPAPGLRSEVEALARTLLEESTPYPGESAEDTARRGGFGYAASELAQLLEQHPPAGERPAPELAAAMRETRELRELLDGFTGAVINVSGRPTLTAMARDVRKRAGLPS